MLRLANTDWQKITLSRKPIGTEEVPRTQLPYLSLGYPNPLQIHHELHAVEVRVHDAASTCSCVTKIT